MRITVEGFQVERTWRSVDHLSRGVLAPDVSVEPKDIERARLLLLEEGRALPLLVVDATIRFGGALFLAAEELGCRWLPVVELSNTAWVLLKSEWGFGIDLSEEGAFTKLLDCFNVSHHEPLLLRKTKMTQAAARGLDAPPVTESAGVVQVPSGTKAGL